MSNTRYKRGKAYAADMAAYARQMSERNTNAPSLTRLKRNLIRALREAVTPRQRQMLSLYYNDELTMREIAALLGIDRSTVSRTIQRGEMRLERCLRYGAASLLRDMEEPEG